MNSFLSCKNNVTAPPYTIQLVEYANPNLPELHSHTHAVIDDKIIMLGGRTNGLHTSTYNLSLVNTNKFVYIIDTHNWSDSVGSWTVYKAPDSLIAGSFTDAFRTNNAEFYTEKNVLYVVGGLRGAKTETRLSVAGNVSSRVRLDSTSISTKTKDTTLPSKTLPTITAINLKDIVNSVMNLTAMPLGAIRQTTDSSFAITGGELEIMDKKVHLVFGWSFSTSDVADYYSHQIRTFTVQDDGKALSISKVSVCPTCWDGVPQFDTVATINNSGDYRRRDGSMSAAIDPATGRDALQYYAGVFKKGATNFDNPVWITKDSAGVVKFTMRSNVYTCQVIPVYSKSIGEFYATLLGGMRNATYNGGSIKSPVELTDKNAPLNNTTDTFNSNAIPYTNQLTTLVRDKQQQYKQYLLPDSFPLLNHDLSYQKSESTKVIKAGTLTYNGAESIFISTLNKNVLPNGVIDYDAFILANPTGGKIGYLQGGILSVADNAFAAGIQQKVTFASNRIFAVKIVPIK